MITYQHSKILNLSLKPLNETKNCTPQRGAVLFDLSILISVKDGVSHDNVINCCE